MKDIPCLCDGRTDIRCTEHHCDLAGPGEPGNPNECRVCWLRLGKRKHRIDPGKQRMPLGHMQD
jgi:hypothetical protein